MEKQKVIFYNSESSSSSDDDCVITSEVAHAGEPYIAFINDLGIALHFIICHNDAKKQLQLKKFIQDRGGCASTTLKDFGPHSAVLVDDKAVVWHHNQDVFKLSYIDACVDAKRILNISIFLHHRSFEFTEDFDYMNIFFFRKYSWNNVPMLFHKKTAESDSNEEQNTENANTSTTSIPCTTLNMKQFGADKRKTNESESDEEQNTENANTSTASTSCTNLNVKQFGIEKRTRCAYTKTEKEAILRYIVKNCLYDHLKGTSIWREMETANVCPIRTWQSMKEHTLKTLSKEIDYFKFLTDNEKKKLKNVLF